MDIAQSGNRQDLPADDARSDAIRIHSQEHTSKMGRPMAPSLYDGLAVEEDLRELGRILSPDDEVEGPPSIISRQRLRLDGSHAGPAGWRGILKEDGSNREPGPGHHVEAIIAKVPWAVLCLGVAAFVCGGVLMTWSIVAQRQELWSTGIPVLLVGQIGFLVGLILQLDRLGHENLHTASKVDRLDHQLHGSTASGRSVLEQGAADQILSDLRGQLDLLSENISREDGQQV